jgi:tetratricopeptide (TPR) repeat protein
VKASKVKILLLCSLAAAEWLAPAGSAHAQSAGAPTRRRPAPGVQQARPRPAAAVNEIIKRATEAREADRLDDAILLYQQALQMQPDWPGGWWYLGAILYEKDRYAEARDAFRYLASIEPKNGPAWAMLGLCEFQTREYDRALVDLQRGRLLGIGSHEEITSVVAYHVGILMTRFEQFEVGFDVLMAFARQQNESPKVIEAFGLNILRMPFLPSEAPADKRELILMAGRAAYHMAARRVEEARKEFEELITRYAQAPNLHYAYGVLLLSQQPDAALEEFRRELEISPAHVPAMLQIAFEYLKRGDYAAGLPFAEKSVQLAPKLFPARNAIGRILLEKGDVARAVKELEIGAQLAPDSPEMHFALARAYARAGRKEEAARERALFIQLDKVMRTKREGAQSVGGVGVKPDEKSPPE